MSGMRGGTMLLVVGLLVAGWGCASGSATPSAAPANIGFEEPEIRSIRVAGSDTMLHLGRRLAAAFMEGHPGVVVRVEGGGTARGVEALIAGDVDLCAASRPLTASEVQRLHATRQVLGVQHLVAMDAIVVMVHPSVGITALTSEQIADLFQGRVRSWADLGGADLDVVPIRRSASSGTHRLMRDILLAGGASARMRWWWPRRLPWSPRSRRFPAPSATAASTETSGFISSRWTVWTPIPKA
jgi:ABC-type phosphate transport system substrate-binding protein